MSLRANIRSRLHRKKPDEKPLLDVGPVPDDTFFDVEGPGSDSLSLTSSFDNDGEKNVYEQHLAQLQEQLVSAMIENQSIAAELKQYKDNETNEKLREELMRERDKTRTLEVQLRRRQGRQRSASQEDGGRPPGDRGPVRIPDDTGGAGTPPDVVPEAAMEVVEEPGRSRLDRLWEAGVDYLYDLFEDFSEITRPEQPVEEPTEPLTVKKLKDNIKRFKVAIKPYMDTVKGFYNIVSWKSPSYTLIVLLVYLYSVWRGWFIPMLFFLAALRIAVNFLHSKNFKFKFAYFDPGEAEQETEYTLGISDRFNLVLQVATKVQNGLGTAADSLEKLKNLFTWRHPEGTRKILTMLCMGFVFSALLPTAFLWKFLGLGLGVKIFLVNFVYNKYPRIKRKYDNNARLWQALPTDAQYDRNYVRAEMDKYIVIPRDGTERELVVNSQPSSDSDSEEEDESMDFRMLFALPASERPLRGWARGKRTVLIGKERSLVTLLTRKRGKIYLTKSFLCFEREKAPSPKNIVIPLHNIVSVDKVKINQRLPGRGMSMQIMINSDGKENVLLFGGIIGREDVVQSIKAAVEGVKRQAMYLPSRTSLGSMSTSSGGSLNQNFTFGAYYEDSE